MITETMNSDLLDDIFAPATAIEKASRFQPKPRITKKKIIPKSSKSAVSEGPSSNPKFPDAAESKRPVEGSSGSSGGHLDVHNPEENFESSISNNVLDKVSQFGIGEPEQRSDVSCSLESLDGHNKNFSVSDLVGDLSHQPITLAEARNSDSDLLDDIFAPATAIEKASRFQPKSRISKKKIIPKSSKSAVSEGPSSNPKYPDAAESKRPAEGTSGSSSGHFDVHNPEEDFEFSISNIVLDKVPQFGVGEREPEQCTVVSCSLESLDGYKKDFSVSGVAGPTSTSNFDLSNFEQISVSSEREECQSSLVNKGFAANIEASDLSLRYANLQTDSAEVGNKPATMRSLVEEPLDDLFLQSDQPAVKQIGKFRPKLSLRVKEGKKTKSVSFVLPNNDGQSPASVEYQTALVTSNPIERIPSFEEMASNQNTEQCVGPLSESNRGDQVGLVTLLREDENGLPAIGTVDILSEPISNSDEHMEKFQTDLRDKPKCAEPISGAAGPIFTSNLDSVFSEPISVSSELEMSHTSLVTKGFSANVETSDLSLKHANLLTYSVEVENVPTTLDSSVDPLDDLFSQSDQPAAKQNGKFRPKLSSCLKEGKKIKSSFVPPDNGVKSPSPVEYQLEMVTSNSLEGITSSIEMTCDQNGDKSLGSLSASNRDNQVDLVNVVSKDEVEISALGTHAILSKASHNSDEHVDKFQTDLQDRTKSSESNSCADSVSSEHEVSQSSLVINGYAANIEASDLSSRHTEVGDEPTTADSSVELLDDLFLQSDQSAGKKVVKCRPKPCLRVKKGKKVKSVTFMLPNNGVEPLASAECQSKSVTLSPLKEITSFVGMLTDQNMDETLGSLSTSNSDNQVDLDEIDLSAIGSLNIISDPNYNSDEHVKKFKTDLLGTGNCAESNPATCRVPITPSGTASGYSQLDSLPMHSDSFDTHSPHFFVDVLVESCEERACVDDLVVQSCVEHEDIRNMEGEDTIDNIEPNLEECAPNTVQNDETLNSSRRVRQRNRKLKSCAVENMASRDQNAKDAISEVHEDYDGVHYMDEDMPKEKKITATRNSLNRIYENESSLKSSKKASEKPDSANKDPPKKKLPHGSRSKNTKRQVNKAYLEIPDDEADRRKLAIRDLIRLAGFKERIASKEAASVKNSFANQSGDQEEDPDADDEDREIKGDGPKLNYHSYMKRPQQIRWSNTETEFFYQAIRQFGTDFAMIQVLFPNRSREQVKAKFKNEQRKRPLQIADAIFRRSKDHSHFEKVIQHLKTAAEQSAKNDPSTVSKDEADENEDERSATNTKDEQEVNYF